MSVRSKTKKDEKRTTAGDDDGGGLKKIVKDMGIIGISQILVAISGIILLPILTRYLGAYGYGLWTNLNVTIGLALPILFLGLHEAIVRIFPAKTEMERGKDLFSIVSVISTITAIASGILFLYPHLLADLVFEGEEFVVRIGAIILFVWCLDKLFLTTFQAFREMKKYATVNVLSKYTEIGLAIFLVVSGYGLIGALSAVLVVRAGLLIILFLYFGKRFGIHRPRLSQIKKIKSYFNYGAPLIPNSLSYWVISASDRYLIAYFLGVTYVGYYAPAYVIGSFFPFTIGAIIYFVLKPTLSELYDKGKNKRVKYILRKFVNYTLIICIPFFFGIILFHYEFTALLAGSEIAEKGSIVAVYTALTGLIYAVYRYYNLVLVLNKKTKTLAKIKIPSSFLNFGANILLIPILGIVGAALTTLVTYLFFTIITIFVANKYISLKFDYQPFIKIMTSALLMYAFVYYIYSMLDIYFLYLIPLGGVVYFMVMIFIRGITKEEIDVVKRHLFQ